MPETPPGAAQLMRAYYQALDAPDLDRLDGLFHDEIDWRFPGQTLTSAGALKRNMQRTLASGLRMNHRIGHILQQGDTALCELVATNTVASNDYIVHGAVVCEAERGRIRRLAAYPEANEMAAFLAALAAARP
ncbi:MAG TPA: nuclear transport factor 2 family protein [Dehalococcoidia bacterium]|nr:nuclear transport factor 2 family protein [Dehalococcoidia bacterium]